MEVEETNPVLFYTESGAAMHFYMRPSHTRLRLQPMIEARGGIVSSKLTPNQNWIKLAAEDDWIKSDDYLSAKYIEDCIAQETLLPTKGYRLKQKLKPTTSPANSAVTHNTSTSGRMKYGSDEDHAILSYITRHPQKSYSGCKFWKKMELLKITGHSWQSMKDRFIKKLFRDLPSYAEAEAAKTKEKKSSDDSKEMIPASDGSISDFDAYLLEEAEKQTPMEVEDDCAHEEIASDSEQEVIPARRNQSRQSQSLRRPHVLDTASSREPSPPPPPPSPSPNRVKEKGVRDDLGSNMDTSPETDSNSEADRVVTFVEKVKKKHKVSAKTVVHLLYFHSGDFSAVLEHLKTGTPREDMVSWTPKDDKKLTSCNPGDIDKLCEKYGRKAVEKRQAFFI